MPPPPSAGSPSDPPCDRDDAGASDAASDATPPVADAAPLTGCAAFDDWEVAMHGIHTANVWVTRMRAFLPSGALTQDLNLTPASQSPVSNVHYATKSINCPPGSSGRNLNGGYACSATETSPADLGSVTLASITAGIIAWVARRRRRNGPASP